MLLVALKSIVAEINLPAYRQMQQQRWGKSQKSEHNKKTNYFSSSDKRAGFGTLLEVAMLKKCTRLWPEAHVEANVLKTSVLERLWKLG